MTAGNSGGFAVGGVHPGAHQRRSRPGQGTQWHELGAAVAAAWPAGHAAAGAPGIPAPGRQLSSGPGRRHRSRKNDVGKKMDFILQEIFRELNTTGVKSNYYEISKLIVDAKNEVEKMREQSMNIE